MKIIQGSAGGHTLKITKAEWEAIGKQAGWGDMLPSERMFGRHWTSSEIDEPEEEMGRRRPDQEEEAYRAFTDASRRATRDFLGKQVVRATTRMQTLLDEAAAGGVDRQDALTRAAHILTDIFDLVKGVDKKENPLGKLRGFLASHDNPHPGIDGLRKMVKGLEEQLGVAAKMPTPQEFKPESGQEKGVTAMGAGHIRITKEAWTKIGKRKGWIGTDKMEAEVKEDTGKLVVQVPGGKESEVEFSYVLTLKPHDKTDSPSRSSTYRITGSSPELSDKEMEFAHEQVKKWMKEHGAENIKAQE